MGIRVCDLIKVYKSGGEDFQALKKVGFTIGDGEICVILGPSGSGKSTLLNIIGGLDEASSGEVVIDGEVINKLNRRDLTNYRRNKLGFIFQFYNLVPNLNVRENIEVCANLSKSPLNIDKLIKDLGLEGMERKFPKELSGGQQQRVAIGRALVKNSKILLCDEPTGALDYKTSIDILNLIKRINKDYGTTILMITHNTSIKELANRVIRLKSGEIIENYINENPKEAEEIQW